MRDEDTFDGIPIERLPESDVPRNMAEKRIEEKALRIIELLRAGEKAKAKKLAREIFDEYEYE